MNHAQTHAMAIVLPHREVFQAVGAGAISSCVLDAALASARSQDIAVLGSAVAEPFPHMRFVPVPSAPWWYGRRTNRYVQGVIRTLRALSPAYIEIHNRPVYVDALRKAFPETPIAVYLHNDPHTIRGIRERTERTRCVEQVEAVICVSEHIRRRMLERMGPGTDAGKLRVVLNGVDTSSIVPAELKRPEITFVGRLSPQKGALLFAQAALLVKERLPQWRFVLIGSRSFDQPGFGTEYERQVVDAMRELGPQGELTGYLPRMQAMARLSAAAIAVIPSQWDEPFCLSALESMANGCAVVASQRGGLPEVVGETGILLDRCDDIDIWANQLLRLAKDAALREHYQRAARQRAVAHLDIRHTSARLDELRAELMTSAGAP